MANHPNRSTNTLRARVLSVNDFSVTFDVNRQERVILWSQLREAAKQEDQDLAGIYARLLAMAERHRDGVKAMLAEQKAKDDAMDEYWSKPNNSKHGSNVNPTPGTH